MRARAAAARSVVPALALVVGLSASTAHAVGALIVNGGGAPLVWSGPVPWNPDRGTLGVLDNAAAVELVDSTLAAWEAVATADVSFVAGAPLAADVTAANVSGYVGVCGDGISPVVFDTDGSITDALFGSGASSSILGFAGPECGSYLPPRITEASAVLNGKFIDGIASAGNPEIDLDDFAGVVVHELGHYLNLDHSQINVLEAFDSTHADDDTIATMFPILVNGRAALTLARDDEVSLAMLYPASDFAATTGAITGQVLWSDGATPFQGAYVIARNVADPRHDAIGFGSGARYYPNNPGGPAPAELTGAYELCGLTPGASYTVEIEPVNARFTAGSSVGPFDTPVTLPGPSEFWSGTDEAATSPPDDPDAPGVPIAIEAGSVVPGVDVILNWMPSLAYDACEGAVAIGALPFTASVDTTNATSAGGDPVQACTTSGRNGHSVWYRLIAPGDGVLTVSTAGSSYDTVVSVHTGSCGALAAVACGDDGAGLQSQLAFPVSSGTPYLIEVTAYGTGPGGTLALQVALDRAASARCNAAAPGTCIPGRGYPRTDCIAEWLVEPTPALVPARSAAVQVPDYRVTCVDGDARCDFDGAVGANGRCTFHLALCLDNSDPRAALAGCSATTVASYELKRPRRLRPRNAVDLANATAILDAVAALAALPGGVAGNTVTFAPGAAPADACTRFVSITVPRGARTIRSKVTTIDRKRDIDELRLTCAAP